MSLESARAFLENALPELENYILSEILYWQVSADNVPLTIGNLYFEIRVLSAYDRTASRLYEDKAAVVRTRWKANWCKKAEREFSNRLKLWEDLFTDAKNDGDIPLAYYKTGARHRCILTMLESEVDLPEEKARLAILDAALRSKRKQNGFIWARELGYVLPREEYWYLY